VSCFFSTASERRGSLPNTLDEGAKIESKILEEDEAEESIEPKRSEVKDEDEEDEPICFFPSIFL
jgi:hypothetical protein